MGCYHRPHVPINRKYQMGDIMIHKRGMALLADLDKDGEFEVIRTIHDGQI